MKSKKEKLPDEKKAGKTPEHVINPKGEPAMYNFSQKFAEKVNEPAGNEQIENVEELNTILKNQETEIRELNNRIESQITELERLRFITNLSSDFVFSIFINNSNSFELEWINRNFRDEIGYPFDYLLDPEKSSSVLYYYDYEKLRVALDESKDGVISYTDLKLFNAKNIMVRYKLTFYPLFDKKIKRVTSLYGTCTKVMPDKKNEYDLQRLNNSLKLQLQEKTILFDNAVKSLHDEIEAKVSAEIRLKELEERLKQIVEFSSYEQLRKLSWAVEQSSSGILITDLNGIIEYANPKITEMTGYEKEEMIGKSTKILNSGKQPDELYKQLWDTILTGNNWRGEFQNKKKSGDLYWDFSSISPIKNDEGVITHFLAVKEDITLRKKIEAELIKSKVEAEDANRAKSFLIANMSHELRTPLNGILGFAQLLKTNEINPEAFEITDKIIYSGKRLLNTLNLVLSATELDGNDYKPNFTDVDLPFLCTYIKSLYEQQANEKNLTFKLDLQISDFIISSDEYLLTGILSNLVNNAIKYTQTGMIVIELKPQVQFEGENFALINVRDTGIGIKKEDQGIIFREFRQVSEGFQRDFEGLGLGLSIANKMAKLLGIKILIQSEWNKGSNFSITIPLKKAINSLKTRANITGGNNPENLSQKNINDRHLKILLVEDNLLNIEVVQLFLRKYWDISSARNGEDAIEIAKKSNYDLFLIDINLGRGIDGMEVLRRIRQINSYQKTPSIALTGYASEKHKRMFLENGFTRFLAKPFEKKELIDVINSVVSSN